MYKDIAHRAVDDHGAQHNITELAILLAVVHEIIRPRLMVEIGSWRGGSLYAWASLAIPVIAVTLPEAAAGPFSAHGARMIWGDSHDAATQAQLAAEIGSRTVDLVFIDGDHTAEGTAADLDLAQKIAPAAVVAVHDINLHRRHPSVGVGEAWAVAAAAWPHMVIAANPDTAPGVGIVWPGVWELPA